MTWSEPHLLDVEHLSADEVEQVMTLAGQMREMLDRGADPGPLLRDQHVALLFAEPSTRTRLSFELAARRLSAADVPARSALVVDGQGRDARRHGAQPRRDRLHDARRAPPPVGRAVGRGTLLWRRTSSMPATAGTPIPPRRCSTCSLCAGRGVAVPTRCEIGRSRSSATSSIRALRARTSGR